MSIIDPVSGYPSDLSELELLKAENKHLRTQLETERLRLAACGTAALGYFDGCKGKYRSASTEAISP